MFKIVVLVSTLIGLSAPLPTQKSIEDTRIVGGENINIAQAPYQISLLFRGRHTCGGTIVASDMIVTAAHCVYGSRASDYQIRVGSSSSSYGGQIYQVGDLSWHKDFSFSKMDNDIALLWLTQPLVFSEVVSPIDMEQQGQEVADGDLTVVTGWGHLAEGGSSPTTLQRVLVPTVNSGSCNTAYSPYYTITSRMICAGVPEGGKDACQGDSGGPMVHHNKLTGVVSWGIGCARAGYPGVYAKVSALRPWLDANISYLRLKHSVYRGMI